MPSFYEFFAGGGMARAGLGPDWTCLFANDIDSKKGATYDLNWSGGVLKTADIRQIEAADLPGYADLAWASPPCQDLSLAGAGAGLKGTRSGAFWPFWDLMNGLVGADRAPRIIVVENVCGAITSHNGEDFGAICAAFARAGYRFGALVIDAELFLPQSRPRLFVIGVRADLPLPEGIATQEPSDLWHTRALWLWWTLPKPPERRARLADLIESNPKNVAWHTPDQTSAILAMMSEVNRAKVEAAQRSGERQVGAVYKRIRSDAFGGKAQRAEVRFDGVAGCLRTPVGGSSRQTIMIVEGAKVRTRLLFPREAARLMGLPDAYRLPSNYNEAYYLIGDGLAVPVVRHLSRHIFLPIIALATERLHRAAA